MQKPEITFESIETESVQKHYPTPHTVVRTVIHYSMTTPLATNIRFLLRPKKPRPTRTAWLRATALTGSQTAEVEGGLVQQLAMNRMLDRHNGEFGTRYRINEFGRYIVTNHPQFNESENSE